MRALQRSASRARVFSVCVLKASSCCACLAPWLSCKGRTSNFGIRQIAPPNLPSAHGVVPGPCWCPPNATKSQSFQSNTLSTVSPRRGSDALPPSLQSSSSILHTCVLGKTQNLIYLVPCTSTQHDSSTGKRFTGSSLSMRMFSFLTCSGTNPDAQGLRGLEEVGCRNGMKLGSRRRFTVDVEPWAAAASSAAAFATRCAEPSCCTDCSA